MFIERTLVFVWVGPKRVEARTKQGVVAFTIDFSTTPAQFIPGP